MFCLNELGSYTRALKKWPSEKKAAYFFRQKFLPSFEAIFYGCDKTIFKNEYNSIAWKETKRQLFFLSHVTFFSRKHRRGNKKQAM